MIEGERVNKLFSYRRMLWTKEATGKVRRVREVFHVWNYCELPYFKETLGCYREDWFVAAETEVWRARTSSDFPTCAV